VNATGSAVVLVAFLHCNKHANAATTFTRLEEDHMSNHESDRQVLKHIQTLVDEEHGLYRRNDLDDDGRQRLASLQVELDQCWDLLRQRRARREFGNDPDAAHIRPASVVENYEQ